MAGGRFAYRSGLSVHGQAGEAKAAAINKHSPKNPVN